MDAVILSKWPLSFNEFFYQNIRIWIYKYQLHKNSLLWFFLFWRMPLNNWTMQQSRNLERPPLCFRLLWSIMLEMQGVPFHAFVGKYNNEETYRCWQSWHVNQSENPPLHRPHDDTSWNYSSAFLDIRKLMIAQGMLYFCAYYTITKDEKIVKGCLYCG